MSRRKKRKNEDARDKVLNHLLLLLLRASITRFALWLPLFLFLFLSSRLSLSLSLFQISKSKSPRKKENRMLRVVVAASSDSGL